MNLESVSKILRHPSVLGEYKSSLYLALSALLDEYFSSEYGPRGGCNSLRVLEQDIFLPYQIMGNLDSTRLFGIDELTLFAFYEMISHLQPRCLDIGANIGLHSIVMAKLGLSVIAFEPDPATFCVLEDNIQRNNVSTMVQPINAAMSSSAGITEFTRVCDNTMSSHVSGSKKNPYGTLQSFDVKTVEAKSFFASAELVKLDAESHELPILDNAFQTTINRPEVLMEVGEDTPSGQLYELLKDNGYSLYSQKSGWQKILNENEIPKSHIEGSMLCSSGPIIDMLKFYLNLK